MDARPARVPAPPMRDAVLAVRVTCVIVSAGAGWARRAGPGFTGPDHSTHPHTEVPLIGVCFSAPFSHAGRGEGRGGAGGDTLQARHREGSPAHPGALPGALLGALFETKVSSVTHVTQPCALLAHPAVVMGRAPYSGDPCSLV